ncbi:ubiquitin thioesterase OTUB2 [Oncorhynchus tshawytscha]|uniref:ubiquitin thioesterase OTUB2 n=1 Tax=Oncorhynchus tshawytscha TaxID=74940 RepID=UPI001C3C2109|nr:ubiquitin thioesterase OTUB2 [Oncorhynchus tshawytscha]
MYIREIRGDGNCFYRTLCFGHLESLLQKDRVLWNNVKLMSLVTLLQLFNEQTTFDSLVQYLRLLTLAYLQNHADFFSHFVEARSLKVYCTQEVETMAMECDHIDILALSEALMEAMWMLTPEGETDSVWATTPFQREPSPPYTSSTKQPTMTFSTHIIAIEGPDKGLHISQVYRKFSVNNLF